MKMKNFNKSCVVAVLTAMSLTSCSDFLEIEPRTQISEDEFYTSENDLDMALNAVINETRVRLMEIWAYSSLLSDESETGGGIGEGMYKTKWDTFQYSPTNSFGSWGYGSWWNEWDFGIYNGVIAANQLLDHIGNSAASAQYTKAVEAEARFWRALNYDYLFMGYEQFPLITEALTPDEMYNVHKGTREEIYEFLLNDLSDDYINALPDRDNTPQGRVCKDAAKVLRAKIILFQRDESRYQQALADMKSIISSGKYQLIPDYGDIWLHKGEWNSELGHESIFEIAYGDKNGTGNGWSHGLGPRDLQDPRSAEQGGLWNGYGQNTMPSTVYNMFKEGDTRREGTVIVMEDEAKKVEELVANGELPEGSKLTWSDQQENYEGLFHYKYTPRKETNGAVDPNQHAVPFRFYRYADVLLLATELDARISGAVSAETQEYFNQVRRRAFRDNDHDVSFSGMSKQQILDRIFEERGYELLDEMQRWFDIMRFDKGAEILGSKGWTEKHRFFPIDQSEIDRSNGNLTQNPGWAN